MQHYSHFGHDEFIVCLGYKGEHIKRYFADSLALGADVTIDFATNSVEVLDTPRDDWRVTLVDTGQWTQTGGRLSRVQSLLGDEPFLMTYGDGVSDVDLDALVAFHRAHGRLATMTAVRPPARFGHLELDGDRIVRFAEKPPASEGWINGAFFVLEPGIFDYIEGDAVDFERAPLENLATDGQLMAYRHEGFWQCMDTVRDRDLLEKLWQGGAPWRTWG
jgi:glucose-1-phosphate cytidylyltransferase